MAVGPLNLTPPVSLEEGISMLSVANQALQDVARRGFVFPERSQAGDYGGILPSNLSRLDDTKLGDLLNQVAIWSTWAASEFAKARQARNQAEAQREFVGRRLRMALGQSTDKRISNPEKEDTVGCDPRYLEAERAYIYCDAVFDFCKLQVEAAQRDWDTVSRHITQRGQEIDRMVRGSNVSNVPVMPSAFRRG